MTFRWNAKYSALHSLSTQCLQHNKHINFNSSFLYNVGVRFWVHQFRGFLVFGHDHCYHHHRSSRQKRITLRSGKKLLKNHSMPYTEKLVLLYQHGENVHKYYLWQFKPLRRFMTHLGIFIPSPFQHKNPATRHVCLSRSLKTWCARRDLAPEFHWIFHLMPAKLKHDILAWPKQSAQHCIHQRESGPEHLAFCTCCPRLRS